MSADFDDSRYSAWVQAGTMTPTEKRLIAMVARLRKMVEVAREALKAAQFQLALVKSNTDCIGSMLCHVDGNCVRCLAATSEFRVRAELAELDRIAGGER